MSQFVNVTYDIVLVGVSIDPQFLPDGQKSVADVLVVGISLRIATDPGNVLINQITKKCRY